jgi:outer membrane immunogenic protein
MFIAFGSRVKVATEAKLFELQGVDRRMKKMMLLGVLILSAAAGYGQESRQDVSFSATGFFGPQVNGNGARLNSTGALGLLTSYRYMLTPHSALELNYSFTQNQQQYVVSFNGVNGQRIHSREQEITGAYVYSLNFKRYSPFAEVGVGGLIFSPIRDFGTQTLDTKQNTNIGGLFGAGLAYELSPSWDIRVEYRGFLVKAPDYGVGDFKTNRYEVFSIPAVGVAYHF